MAKVLVAVGAEATEGIGPVRTYVLRDLTVLQLAYLLDDLVDELVARDVWTGPRPQLRREPVPSRAIGRFHAPAAAPFPAPAAGRCVTRPW